MADRITQDRALARIMGLHKTGPAGDDELQKALRPILTALYSSGRADERERIHRLAIDHEARFRFGGDPESEARPLAFADLIGKAKALGSVMQATPVGVWDTRDDETPWQQAADWAREHVTDARYTYRAEFYRGDPSVAILYRYARDEKGRIIHDPVTDRAMLAEPVTQTLGELPPRRLLAS